MVSKLFLIGRVFHPLARRSNRGASIEADQDEPDVQAARVLPVPVVALAAQDGLLFVAVLDDRAARVPLVLPAAPDGPVVPPVVAAPAIGVALV